MTFTMGKTKDGKVRPHQDSISCLGGSPQANLKVI